MNVDCLVGLREMESNSVDCVVTSPPYYGLRDYGHEGQIGLEESPVDYVRKMVEVFSEVHRVLKPGGTLWLNLGDSYASFKDCKSTSQTLAKGTKSEVAHQISKGLSRTRDTKMLKSVGLKNKDLIGIPWRVAFALQDAGWYLRQDIIWSKPNPMPESVTDRCTKSHEYIFLLTKSAKYHFDCEAIQEKAVSNHGSGNGYQRPERQTFKNYDGTDRGDHRPWVTTEHRRRRSVWTVATKPFKEAHFATFPEDLVMPCVLAGCVEGGIVLDPFMGAGTTAVVALRTGRRFIGFELNSEYVSIANKRIEPYLKQLRLF